jgi:hypothetical protein
MNKVFDYNGTLVSASKPVKSLKTTKKVVTIDSKDRDFRKYLTNGEFTVLLPRTYENVVSIRLMSAEFPPLYVSNTSGLAGASRYAYINNDDYSYTENLPNPNQSAITQGDNVYYFLIDLFGLNKCDECVVGAGSSNIDGFYAKIPAIIDGGKFIEYNDHSGQENVARYSPAIGKLDRIHIRTRLHSQQGNTGFIYWTTDGRYAKIDNSQNYIGAEYSLTLEIECLDNSFDDFSQFESRLSNRA